MFYSTGSGGVKMFLKNPLQPQKLSKRFRKNLKAGAFVSFEGWVRNHHEGKKVLRLEYEVYVPMAMKELENITLQTKQKFGVFEIQIHHRVGVLKPGEIAVWVGVTGEHREECFKACEHVMKELKSRAPIWKHETYEDHSQQWIHCPNPCLL